MPARVRKIRHDDLPTAEIEKNYQEIRKALREGNMYETFKTNPYWTEKALKEFQEYDDGIRKGKKR